jgi:hypothetical protein
MEALFISRTQLTKYLLILVTFKKIWHTNMAVLLIYNTPQALWNSFNVILFQIKPHKVAVLII